MLQVPGVAASGPMALPRRIVLGAALAAPVLFAGACSSSDSGSGRSSDDQVREEVANAEATLIASYDAVIAAFPNLAGRLQPFRDQHVEHRAAMGVGDGTAKNEAVISAPTSESKAVRELRKAERSAAVARRDSAQSATAQDLVATLALVSASEAQHGAALAASA